MAGKRGQPFVCQLRVRKPHVIQSLQFRQRLGRTVAHGRAVEADQLQVRDPLRDGNS